MARLKARSNLEETLWLQFRGTGLAARCTREYRFAPPRRFKFDFAFLHNKVAVECEGGIWINGGHNRGAIYESNCEKYNLATERGWRVLRYTIGQIESGEAIAQIERVMGPCGMRGEHRKMDGGDGSHFCGDCGENL